MSAKTDPQNKKTWKNFLEVNNLTPNFFGEKPKKTDLPSQTEKAKIPQRKEFTLFNYTQYYEQEIVKKRIKELIELIRKEIELIKKSNKSLLAEVKDIERLTTERVSEKPGVYHVRFLEAIFSILRNIRKKVGESKTWLEALITRKKKRGSLFLFRSKKMGTIYSLSQELQATRSVQ